MSDEDTLRGRVTRTGEEKIGRLAQDLLENPVVTGALSRAFETRQRALRVQEVAMGALGLPSANDLERLTRRVRSVSQRLEAIEDGLDRLEDRLGKPDGLTALERRLERIEAALQRLEATAAPAVSPGVPGSPAPGPATTPAAAPAPTTRRSAPRTRAASRTSRAS